MSVSNGLRLRQINENRQIPNIPAVIWGFLRALSTRLKSGRTSGLNSIPRITFNTSRPTALFLRVIELIEVELRCIYES